MLMIQINSIQLLPELKHKNIKELPSVEGTPDSLHLPGLYKTYLGEE